MLCRRVWFQYACCALSPYLIFFLLLLLQVLLPCILERVWPRLTPSLPLHACYALSCPPLPSFSLIVIIITTSLTINIIIKSNMYIYYYSFSFTTLFRRNLHVVLAFSPVGDAFRTRVRKFPALVNCTVIDWFQPWPHEALFSVGTCTREREGKGREGKGREN